jgi:L-ascorbate metabolism protein UlaG (beta-lactamase superfamily)
MLRKIMISIAILLVGVPLLAFAIGAFLSAPSYKGKVSDHYDGKAFFNPHRNVVQGFSDVLKWMLNRKSPKWPSASSPAYGKRPLDSEREFIRITFVNHSTFLIQVDGLNILTDPIWSQRASPFTWAGPKRTKYPGIKLEDLPRIHAVLVSHNHYDHLDIETMRILFGGHHPRVITPLGVKAFLDSEGVTGATDLDWWQESPLSDSVVVQAVPAQHFSGRGMSDRNQTLWCGYVIKTSRGNIYFAGDTGYNTSDFKSIGDKVGPMRISLLPIGAYLPRWFMSPVHVSPDEAVLIHQDVKSMKSIGMHFGTFPLADEGPGQAERDLNDALQKHGVARDQFITLVEGEVLIVE